MCILCNGINNEEYRSHVVMKVDRNRIFGTPHLDNCDRHFSIASVLASLVPCKIIAEPFPAKHLATPHPIPSSRVEPVTKATFDASLDDVISSWVRKEFEFGQFLSLHSSRGRREHTKSPTFLKKHPYLCVVLYN